VDAAIGVLWNSRVGEPHQHRPSPGATNHVVVDEADAPSLSRAQARARAGDTCGRGDREGGARWPPTRWIGWAGACAGPRPADERQPYKTALKPLSIDGGYFVVDGRVVLARDGCALWQDN